MENRAAASADPTPTSADPEHPPIGWIGLGNMGRNMAANLIAAGYPVTVNDLRAGAAAELVAQGASWADSPAAVARASRVTLAALPGPAEVEAVILGPGGVLEGASAGDLMVDTSTSTPSSIRRIAEAASARDVGILDAPVSGGVRGARKGTLTIMVGGDRDAFTTIEPILRVLGSNVFHMGELGAGYVSKLVNNFMGMSNAIASMEAMVMGTRAGVDPSKLLEVVDLGTGMSHMTRTLYPFLIFPGRFEPVRFSMDLAVKDFRLALNLADELGLTARVGQAVHAALASAAASGLADADMSAYITLLEDEVGVKVRA